MCVSSKPLLTTCLFTSRISDVSCPGSDGQGISLERTFIKQRKRMTMRNFHFPLHSRSAKRRHCWCCCCGGRVNRFDLQPRFRDVKWKWGRTFIVRERYQEGSVSYFQSYCCFIEHFLLIGFRRPQFLSQLIGYQPAPIFSPILQRNKLNKYLNWLPSERNRGLLVKFCRFSVSVFAFAASRTFSKHPHTPLIEIKSP